MTICALAIAASDPSGGAGMEADLKVFCAHQIFGLSAVTAITVQDTRGVRSVHPGSAEVFRRILGNLADDQPISAVKIGAMASAAHLRAIRDFLESLDPLPPVVLDPVLKATSGVDLFPPEEASLITEHLIEFAALITPNLPEAEILTRQPVTDLASMRRAAVDLCQSGARAALVKGGHLKADSHDVLCWRGQIKEWQNDRIPHEFHGTGCVLASAIAANLARGSGIEEAVARGRDYLRLGMVRARKGRGDAYLLDFPPASPLK